jgi:arylsulfatase A-like enzyme
MTPHHVPQQWIERYRGQFDKGWDESARRPLPAEGFRRDSRQCRVYPAPDGLPAWDSLTPQQKKLLAHEAEVYAGYAEHTDHEIGRLLDAIREEGQADNTVILWIFGDNGASAEGGLEGHDAVDVNGKPKTIEERTISPTCWAANCT